MHSVPVSTHLGILGRAFVIGSGGIFQSPQLGGSPIILPHRPVFHLDVSCRGRLDSGLLLPDTRKCRF